MARSSAAEEKKLTLPAGHPQSGYKSPDTSFVDGIGQFDAETQKARDEAADALEEENAAIEDSEHKVATAEQKKLEEQAKADRERLEKIAAGDLSFQQAAEQRQAEVTLAQLGDEMAPAPATTKASSSSASS